MLTADREQQKVAGGSQAGRGEVAGPQGHDGEAAGRYRRARAANLRHVVGWPERAVILPRLYVVRIFRFLPTEWRPAGARSERTGRERDTPTL